jgi:hypothetical protein
MSKKPIINVTGNISDFNETVKKEAIKQSNFYLTINLNQGYNEDDNYLESDTQIFDEVLSDVLNRLDEFVTLPEGVFWNDDTINNVDVDYIIEKGHNQKRLHSHILIKIKHKTTVKLDFVKIKRHICDTLGLKNIYMKNIMSKSNENNILEYINKYSKN